MPLTYSDHNGTFSPDGTQIAFISPSGGDPTNNNQVYIMNADGSNRRQLTHLLPNKLSYPNWSPDGKQILFLETGVDLVGNTANPKVYEGEISIINADGTGYTQITKANSAAPISTRMFWYEPTFSPDGTQIAAQGLYGNFDDLNGVSYWYSEMSAIYLMNRDGSNAHAVTPIYSSHPGTATLPTENGYVNSPCFHPDGKSIIYRSRDYNAPGGYATTGISSVDLSTGKETIIRKVEGERYYYPNYSPDGTKICFHAHAGGDPESTELTNTGDLFSLAFDAEYRPGDNIIPPGYSSFDQPEDLYHFAGSVGNAGTSKGTANTRPYPITSAHDTVQASKGIYTGLGIRDNTYIGTTSFNTKLYKVYGWISGWYSGTSIDWARMTLSNNHSQSLLDEGEDDFSHHIKIPKGKKWIASFWAKGYLSNVTADERVKGYSGALADGINTNAEAGPNTRIIIYGSNTSSNRGQVYFPDRQNIALPADGSWKRISQFIDLSSSDVPGASGPAKDWRAWSAPGHHYDENGDPVWWWYGGDDNPGGMSLDAGAQARDAAASALNQWERIVIGFGTDLHWNANTEYFFDGFQLEESIDGRTTPSDYKAPRITKKDVSTTIGWRHIYTMDADGTNMEQLTSDITNNVLLGEGLGSPPALASGGVQGISEFSPDGSKIIYSNLNDSFFYDICAIDIRNKFPRLSSMPIKKPSGGIISRPNVNLKPFGNDRVHTKGTNIMPRAYSSFDLDPNLYDYISGGGYITFNTPEDLRHIARSANVGISTSHANGIVVPEGFQPGVGSIKYTSNALSPESPWSYLNFAKFDHSEFYDPERDQGAIRIPTGKRWILSWYERRDSPQEFVDAYTTNGSAVNQSGLFLTIGAKRYANGAARPEFSLSENGAANNMYISRTSWYHPYGYRVSPVKSVESHEKTWQRNSLVVDLTEHLNMKTEWTPHDPANTYVASNPYHYPSNAGANVFTTLYADEVDTLGFLIWPDRMKFDAGDARYPGADANNYWFSGFQLEEVNAGVTHPSPYKKPEGEIISDTFSPDSINSLAGWWKADSIAPEDLEHWPAYGHHDQGGVIDPIRDIIHNSGFGGYHLPVGQVASSNSLGSHTAINIMPPGHSHFSMDDKNIIDAFGGYNYFPSNPLSNTTFTRPKGSVSREPNDWAVVGPGCLKIQTPADELVGYTVGGVPTAEWGWINGVNLVPQGSYSSSNKKIHLPKANSAWLVSMYIKTSNTACPQNDSIASKTHFRMLGQTANTYDRPWVGQNDTYDMFSASGLTGLTWGDPPTRIPKEYENKWWRTAALYRLDGENTNDGQEEHLNLDFSHIDFFNANTTILLDGIMVEEYIPSIHGLHRPFTPSPYVPPSMNGGEVVVWKDRSPNHLDLYSESRSAEEEGDGWVANGIEWIRPQYFASVGRTGHPAVRFRSNNAQVDSGALVNYLVMQNKNQGSNKTGWTFDQVDEYSFNGYQLEVPEDEQSRFPLLLGNGWGDPFGGSDSYVGIATPEDLTWNGLPYASNGSLRMTIPPNSGLGAAWVMPAAGRLAKASYEAGNTSHTLEGAGRVKISAGKKWLCSYWTYTNSVHYDTSISGSPFEQFGPRLWVRNSKNPMANIAYIDNLHAKITSNTAWERQAFYLDLRDSEEFPPSATGMTRIAGTADGTHDPFLSSRVYSQYETEESIDAGHTWEPLRPVNVDTIWIAPCFVNGITSDMAGNTVWVDGFMMTECPLDEPTSNSLGRLSNFTTPGNDRRIGKNTTLALDDNDHMGGGVTTVDVGYEPNSGGSRYNRGLTGLTGNNSAAAPWLSRPIANAFTGFAVVKTQYPATYRNAGHGPMQSGIGHHYHTLDYPWTSQSIFQTGTRTWLSGDHTTNTEAYSLQIEPYHSGNGLMTAFHANGTYGSRGSMSWWDDAAHHVPLSWNDDFRIVGISKFAGNTQHAYEQGRSPDLFTMHMNGRRLSARNQWFGNPDKIAEEGGGVDRKHRYFSYGSNPDTPTLFDDFSYDGMVYESELAMNGAPTIGYSRSNDNSDALNQYYFLDADVAEVVWFNEQLSQEEIEKLEGYLAHKYGLQDTLISQETASNRIPSEISIFNANASQYAIRQDEGSYPNTYLSTVDGVVVTEINPYIADDASGNVPNPFLPSPDGTTESFSFGRIATNQAYSPRLPRTGIDVSGGANTYGSGVGSYRIWSGSPDTWGLGGGFPLSRQMVFPSHFLPVDRSMPDSWIRNTTEVFRYALDIPAGHKWTFSYAHKTTSLDFAQTKAYVWYADGVHETANWDVMTLPLHNTEHDAINTWKVMTDVLDFTTDDFGDRLNPAAPLYPQLTAPNPETGFSAGGCAKNKATKLIFDIRVDIPTNDPWDAVWITDIKLCPIAKEHPYRYQKPYAFK